jgi:hypothetical protein
MKTKRGSFALILILSLLAAATGLACAVGGKGPLESDFPYAASMVDTVLAGIAEKDYGKFSKDFSEAMKGAIDEKGFPGIVAQIDEALGKYASRSFLGATKAKAKGKDLVIMKYRAVYEKDDQATLSVYITDYDGKKMIDGFAAYPAGSEK